MSAPGSAGGALPARATLDTPLALRSGLVLRNRIAKAAMTEALAKNGDPNATLDALYGAWSDGGAGLLITGNAMIDRRFLERVGNVILDERSDRAALARWATASRRGGAAAIVQLSHPGRQVSAYVSGAPVAPSAVAAVKVMRAFARPRALSEHEIVEIIERFGAAAKLIDDAGFDGVQIHAAHGYLVSQFLSPQTNRRTDGWGGPLEKRARFLLEIVRLVRERCRPGFTIAVKLNSADFQRGGFSEGESLEVVSMLDRASIDLLEISGGTYESAALLGYDESGRPSTREREAYFLDFAETARARTSVPVMLTGGIRSRAVMDAALASGAIDVVGMARPFCVQPDLPQALLVRGEPRVTSPAIPKVGVRVLEALAETAWCDEQMARIGRGEKPDLALGARWTTLVHFLRDVSGGLARRAVL